MRNKPTAEKRLTEPVYDDEGFVDYIHDGHTYKSWYGGTSSGSLPPVLILYGGPGGNHPKIGPSA